MYRWRYSFFGLSPEYKLQVHGQIFELSYFSQGAVNVQIAYNLPVFLRNFYYAQLANIKNKESDSYKEPAKKSGKVDKPF